jgi:DNA repair photolyase
MTAKPKTEDTRPPGRVARYETTDTCAECRFCNGTICEDVRKPNLRNYGGIRFTADGFDCALPVSIDSHSHCSYGCLYCFSDNLVQHREATTKSVGQMSLRFLDDLFGGRGGKPHELFRKALKYDRRNAGGFPCPVQLGAINDPCDNIERHQGWLLGLIDLAIKHNQPIRMSTKGSLFLLPEYQRAIAKAPHLFWIAFSIISPDDDLMARIDRRAPLPSERIATMKALSRLGVATSLRFRPMMPGASDRTSNYPKAYKALIEMAAEAGAQAISFETVFGPGMVPKTVRWRWDQLEQLIAFPIRRFYKTFGPTQACMRPAFGWTENIMHATAEEARASGLTVGVSDPVWKQLGEAGCCCGILPDHPVFGNWQRESATNRLLEARDTGRIMTLEDVTPAWSREARLTGIVNTGPGPDNKYLSRHALWSDHIAYVWDNPEVQRGVLTYFQGALWPVGRDEHGHMKYEYRGLERANRPHVPYWSVEHAETSAEGRHRRKQDKRKAPQGIPGEVGRATASDGRAVLPADC